VAQAQQIEQEGQVGVRVAQTDRAPESPRHELDTRQAVDHAHVGRAVSVD
jgi:hypothetical protein